MNGSKIEAKFDWDSIKTGNHYLEITQTSDNKKTWMPSGFSISADEADFWVVINEDWIRIFPIDVLKEYLSAIVHLVAKTGSGVNYNQPGQFSKAYIIPFTKLDVALMTKFQNPLPRKK